VALARVWEASGRLGAKRLVPFLPELLPRLERHGELTLEAPVRARLLALSAATADRLLGPHRRPGGGPRPPYGRPPAAAALRALVPVRTWGEWAGVAPGALQADLVLHCGESTAGFHLTTLVAVDVASGWTELQAVWGLGLQRVGAALHHVRRDLPVPLRERHTDTGGEFLNEAVYPWCRRHGIRFTRGRPHRKNDQAWVEQKNGAIVRRLVGYGRFEGLASAAALARLYAAARLHGNLFQPSFKLQSKTRIGARVTKRCHAAEPPLARVLAHLAIDSTAKERLKTLQAMCDPILLLNEIRAAQAELGTRVDRRGVTPVREASGPALEQFVAHLGTAWRDGERRPTHRRPYRRVKPIPKRPSALDPVQREIDAWLAEQPTLSAVAVLDRLRVLHPGIFDDLHVRTVQRAVKAWRSRRARGIILEGTMALNMRTPVDLVDDASASPTAPPAPPLRPPSFSIDDMRIAGNIAI
jgi:hypothetical protein